MTNAVSPALPQGRYAELTPGVGAAVSFSIADVLSKVVFASGMDVLSLVMLRGVLATALFWWWLRISPPRLTHSARVRTISLGLGLLYAGTVFGLLFAIQVLPLSVAILAYFIYPLLTGISAAAIRLERLGWRSFAIAGVSFCGLALMLGAEPVALAPLGLIAAFAAATFRTISLLITRAELGGTDARVTTQYTLVSSSVVFLAASLVSGSFHPPLTHAGWIAFAGLVVTATLSVWGVFVSTARIGAFRTAVLMNLEPVLSSCFSFAVMGERVGGLQLLGGAIMIGSLCAFQVRR